MLRQIRWLAVVLSVLLIGPMIPMGWAGPATKLEIFSWWTAGGEAEGLGGLFSVYKRLYPNVEIINATVAGGAGAQAKAVLATRLTGGDPPDSFQVHAGLEVQKYDPARFLEPLDDLFKSEGWERVLPPGLLTLLRFQDRLWSVPVNIHRANVLWYSKKIFAANNLTPPKTFDEFFKSADTLKAKGIVPFVFGDKEGWEAGHVFEVVLIGVLGADGYRGLWTGKTAWTDAKVTAALNTFKRMLTYVNSDHAALTWDGAGQYMIDGKGAMQIMGDWQNGWFQSKGFADYGWALPPGNAGIFDALSDSFALPKGAKNRQNAINWLKVTGSKAGQEAFNPKKGSICGRTDCNQALFNDYLKSAAKDWTTHKVAPSVMHGAATYESWATRFKDIIALFVTSGNVAKTQADLQAACKEAGFCK